MVDMQTPVHEHLAKTRDEIASHKRTHLAQISVRLDKAFHRPVHAEERRPVRPLLERLRECFRSLVRRDHEAGGLHGDFVRFDL